MAVAHVCAASLSVSLRDACLFNAPKPPSSCARFPQLNAPSFATGSPLLISTSYERKTRCKAKPISIRCGPGTQEGNSFDVWLGRLAMVAFAVVITVEFSTGKGLLESFGITAPLPTVALAITAFVGVLTAVFIFQSASKN